MEEQEDAASKNFAGGTPDVPSGSRQLSKQARIIGEKGKKSQMGSGMWSRTDAEALDDDDGYFTQEGFSYTELLLGVIAAPPSYKQPGDKALYLGSKDGEIFEQNQPRNDEPRTNSSICVEGNLKETFSSLLGDTNDDPWMVNMFDDIELEQVYDKEATGEVQNDNQGGDGQDSEAPRKSGVYNEQASTSRSADRDLDGSCSEQNNVITEEDIDDFLADENLTPEQRNQRHNEAAEDFKPEIGMEFKTREDVQKFFNTYSYMVGFSVSCVSVYRTTNKRRNNEIIRFTMKCNKHGKNTEKEKEQPVAQRQTTVIAKTDCKFEMVASEKNGVWRVTALNLLHNHVLSPQSRFFRCHIYMSDGEKELIRTMKHCNMPTRDMVAVLAFIRGGMTQLPYNKRRVSNYCASINREVSNNDMMEVWDWFWKKRNEDPGFYYAIQYDENKKVRCVFWADAKARQYYDICGDCISFDTTFLTNRYNLPFAPFVGVSPHANTYLFGCAFIVDEKADTFIWLFEQFLQAMGGKHPISIITDADKAMENAIPTVFPNATHRGCLFHVKKKIDDKGGTVFQANDGLYEELQDIIDKSLTKHEFETLWHSMIAEHDVGHVKIFQDLWKTRERWVPVYFKSKFFPFIQTTARSEGTNALFKRGVGAQFSLTSFLREYQRIIDTIHAKEEECEHNNTHKKVPDDMFLTKYYIERQAHDLYNLAIFKKFQHTLNDVTRLNLSEETRARRYWVFQAKNYAFKEHRPRKYLVQVNEESEQYSCICCRFEKDGMICSHILKVMLHLQVEKIPDKYIIDRWRKKDKKLFPVGNLTMPANDDSTVLRFNVLSRMLGHTASNASMNKRKYEYLLQEITRIDGVLAQIDNENEEASAMGQNSSTKTVVNLDPTDDSASTLRLQNPDVVDQKGRPRLLTIKERIKKKMFYSCSHCGSTEHTIKKCTQTHIEFNLPKRKRDRKKQPANGNESVTANRKKSKAASKKQINEEQLQESSCQHRDYQGESTVA